MSDMWVAVTAEYDGSTFSHRSTRYTVMPPRSEALRYYGLLLDDAAHCVRSGLAGWLPPQNLFSPLSEHEKLRAIEKIVDDKSTDFIGTLQAIEAVLKR